MIRVLHILHSMNRGGAEAMLMNYYRNIDRSEVQFDFLLTEHSRCQYEDEIESLGGRVFRVPLLKFRSPMPYFVGVEKFLREHPEYRIVHSHTSSKSAVPLWIAKRCGVPVRVCHAHSSSSGSGVEGFVRDTLGIWLKKVATDFMSCGEGASRCWYGDKYTDEGKVKIVPNAVDLDNFRFDEEARKMMRERLHFGEDEYVLGMVSRFHPVKNHLFALDVLADLRSKNVNAKLLFVGDGELRNEIENKIQLLHLEKDVVLAGIVNDVYRYLQAMDMVLMPSFNEGLPVSMIEAQSTGAPCIISTGVPCEIDVTGNVDFVPLDVERWADCVMKRMKSSTHRDSDAVRKVQQAGYDIKLAAQELQAWYLMKYKETERLHKNKNR